MKRRSANAKMKINPPPVLGDRGRVAQADHADTSVVARLNMPSTRFFCGSTQPLGAANEQPWLGGR
jgi:hypothetical protein